MDSSEQRIATLEREIATIRAMVLALTKQQGTGLPVGVQDPNTPIYADITGHSLVLLCASNSAKSINFANVTAPIAVGGKVIKGLVPVQLAGAQYWLAVYQ